MNRILMLLGLMMFSVLVPVKAGITNGLILIESQHSVTQSLDRLDSILRSKGMTIFNRVKHSSAAKDVGIELRDTELLIFGNPKIGSKLMACSQTSAIDLPLKAIAYKDGAGRVWMAYNAPEYVAGRHGAKGCGEVIKKMTIALRGFINAAASGR